jgi:hypothetical protein
MKYLGTAVKLNTKVRVYRNLHNKKYSIQSYIEGKGWRVVRHVEQIDLGAVTFKVNDAGRERVRRENRKNVHAYIEGLLVFIPDPYEFYDCSHRVAYDPYTMETFEADTGRTWEPIYKAKYAHLRPHGVWAV